MKMLTEKDNFLYLAMLALVFIASTALVIAQKDNLITQEPEPFEVKAFSPLPVLKNGSTFPVISAQAVMVIDLDSYIPLYEKNPKMPLLPASTTKIVTALVAMDYYDDNDVLDVTNPSVDGRKMGLLEGEEISAGALLDGLLIYSGNDAAEVLAQNYSGGRDEFINAMNAKAMSLNLEDSNFTNPAGLDFNSHVSTAKDLVRVSIVAMQNPRFASIVRQKQKQVASIDGKIKHNLKTTNELLGEVEGVFGVKTGWTENARENLVTYLERDDRKIMIALMASQDRFGETRELIDWIFENYEWEEVNVNYSEL